MHVPNLLDHSLLCLFLRLMSPSFLPPQVRVELLVLCASSLLAQLGLLNTFRFVCIVSLHHSRSPSLVGEREQCQHTRCVHALRLCPITIGLFKCAG